MVGLKADLKKWRAELREDLTSGMREVLATQESSVLGRLKAVEQRVTMIQTSLEYCFQHARGASAALDIDTSVDYDPNTVPEN
jgi:hypothetical protein